MFSIDFAQQKTRLSTSTNPANNHFSLISLVVVFAAHRFVVAYAAAVDASQQANKLEHDLWANPPLSASNQQQPQSQQSNTNVGGALLPPSAHFANGARSSPSLSAFFSSPTSMQQPLQQQQSSSSQQFFQPQLQNPNNGNGQQQQQTQTGQQPSFSGVGQQPQPPQPNTRDTWQSASSSSNNNNRQFTYQLDGVEREREHNDTNVEVDVEVVLQSYANPSFVIGRDAHTGALLLCACPQQQGTQRQRCIQGSLQRTGFNCLFAFTVVVSARDGPVGFASTPHMPLNQFGQVVPNPSSSSMGVPQQQQLQSVIAEDNGGGDEGLQFQRPFVFRMKGQPTSITVLVHNLGGVIDQQTGAIIESNSVTLVDTFQRALDDVVPAATAFHNGGGSFSNGPVRAFGLGVGGGGGMSGAEQQQTQLTGNLLGTRLSLAYSLACRGRLIGAGCDLACNTSAINSNAAVCRNEKTGFFSLCRWVRGKTQVDDCKHCPWGFNEDAYCMDERGGVLEGSHAGVVSTDFRTATIALGALCGLLIVCLFICSLCLFLKSLRHRIRRGRRRQSGGAGAAGGPSATFESSKFVSGTGSSTGERLKNPPLIFTAFKKQKHDDGEKPPPPYVSMLPSATPRGSGSSHLPPVAVAGGGGSVISGNGGGGEGTTIRVPIPPPKSASSKPSMRSGYQPLPSLANPTAFTTGGGGPNDSFNTSFSHTPSVSADV